MLVFRTDVKAKNSGRNAYFCPGSHGSVAVFEYNVSYLLASLASKAGKTDIGDTLVKKNNSRLVAYLHLLQIFPL